MKKINAIVLGLALTSSLNLISCDDKENVDPIIETPTEDESKLEVTVPDAELAKYIRFRTKIATDAKITRGDMAKLDSIHTVNIPSTSGVNLRLVEKLNGLEFAINLVYVDLEKNVEVSDLSPLKDLQNITYLHLGETAVIDLSPVKNFRKVKYFRINDTKVTSIAALADYTTLTYFNANTVKTLTDISPLAKNVGLQEMILRDVPVGNEGLATIVKFEKLYRLNARSTGITRVTEIATLMGKGALLKTTAGAAAAGSDATLDLRGNTILDYSPIQSYIDNGTAVTVNM